MICAGIGIGPLRLASARWQSAFRGDQHALVICSARPSGRCSCSLIWLLARPFLRLSQKSKHSQYACHSCHSCEFNGRRRKATLHSASLLFRLRSRACASCAYANASCFLASSSAVSFLLASRSFNRFCSRRLRLFSMRAISIRILEHSACMRAQGPVSTLTD